MRNNTIKLIVFFITIIYIATIFSFISARSETTSFNNVTSCQPGLLQDHPEILSYRSPAHSSRAMITPQKGYITIDLAEATDPLGVLQCEGVGINNNGEVVGYEVLNFSKYRSIYWSQNGSATILENYADDNSSRPYMITDDGLILGWSAFVTYIDHGSWVELRMNQTAVTWTNLEVTNLNDDVTGGDTLDLYHAMDINETGVIIGSGAPPGNIPPPWWPNGYIFNQGVVTDLGYFTFPEAINDLGHIAGYIEAGFTEAHIWGEGTLVNLNNHSSIHAHYSKAFDLNNEGIVVGFAQMEINTQEEPIIWVNHEPIRPISSSTTVVGSANAVNEQGQVVGYYIDLDSPNPQWLAFLWKDGEYITLNDYLPTDQGWADIYPEDINDFGQITGLGYREGYGWRAFLMTPNSAPDTPLIVGPTEGVVGDTYEYTISTTDPDDNPVYYYIDWGDNTTSGWLGPYPSGQQLAAHHAWNTTGNYLITIKAKDMYDAESNWSDPLEVVISENHIDITVTGGLGITVSLRNIGSTDVTNVNWSITLDGGFLLFGKTKTGVIDISAGETVTIKSNVFGFGKPTITVTADMSEKTTTGLVMFFFVLGVP